jgi:hypothetical protein
VQGREALVVALLLFLVGLARAALESHPALRAALAALLP